MLALHPWRLTIRSVRYCDLFFFAIVDPQEVRAADDNVVAPSDLHLPKDSEVQKYAAFMLGLSFPFPTCCGDCNSSHRCFACHTMEEDKKQCILFARFTVQWKHWKAYMTMRRYLAEERILAGLSAPVIRDLASVRPYVSGINDTGAVFQALEDTFWRRSEVDCRYHDVLRICERVAWFADVSVPFHYTQLTSQEFLSHLQTAWMERFEQHCAARRVSSSRRTAERYALMTALDKEEDLEDDSAPPIIEGQEVEDDLLLQEELDNLERAQWPVDGEALHEAMFRELDWMKVLSNRKPSVLQDTLRSLRDFVNGLGGVPNARTNLGISGGGVTGVGRDWTFAEAQRSLMLQKQYLEFCVGGGFLA